MGFRTNEYTFVERKSQQLHKIKLHTENETVLYGKEEYSLHEEKISGFIKWAIT
jgi:hypothetical protein